MPIQDRYGWTYSTHEEGLSQYDSPDGRFVARKTWRGSFVLTDRHTWQWSVSYRDNVLRVSHYSQEYDSLRECVERSERWHGAYPTADAARAAGEAVQKMNGEGSIRVHTFHP